MVECVNLCITDRCNRACPDCCCDVPRIKEHWDIDLAGISRAAEAMHGIRRVTLTGGEPTLHLDFGLIARSGKTLFGCESFEIGTNGKMGDVRRGFLPLFDLVTVTRYGPPEFEESNDAEIEKIRGVVLPSSLVVDSAVIHHVPRSHRGVNSCERGAGITVALYKDRVYPCCMGWGIGTSESVPLSANWEQEVMALPRPCKDCFFS